MPSTNDSRRGVEKWLVRHAKELGLPSVPKGLKALARKHLTYMLNYITWRDSVIMTDGALGRKHKLLIALGAVTLTWTRDEVVEAMFVAAVFSGGPGLVALSNVLGMLDK